jgi:hypothetical protein
MKDLRSWWEEGGVWAGYARPNTSNLPLNCVTPMLLDFHAERMCVVCWI